MRRYGRRGIRFAVEYDDPTVNRVFWSVQDLVKDTFKADECLTDAVVNAKTLTLKYPQSVEVKQLFESLKKVGRFMFELQKANSEAEKQIKKIRK